MKLGSAATLVAVLAATACHDTPARETVRTGSAESAPVGTPLLTAPWCSHVDLQPMPVGAPSGLAGATGYFLQARNVSPRACRVQGFAANAQARTANTTWRTVHVGRGTPLGGDYTAAGYLIHRGGVAVVDLATSHDAAARRVWHGIRLKLPHMRGWITWTGVIRPGPFVGLGPVRNSER
jgi:hypothetical protein